MLWSEEVVGLALMCFMAWYRLSFRLDSCVMSPILSAANTADED